MWILLPNINLRCFVARQFLSQIYALLSVKFSGLKMCECKKNDKYQVCQWFVLFIFCNFSLSSFGGLICLFFLNDLFVYLFSATFPCLVWVGCEWRARPPLGLEKVASWVLLLQNTMQIQKTIQYKYNASTNTFEKSIMQYKCNTIKFFMLYAASLKADWALYNM